MVCTVSAPCVYIQPQVYITRVLIAFKINPPFVGSYVLLHIGFWEFDVRLCIFMFLMPWSNFYFRDCVSLSPSPLRPSPLLCPSSLPPSPPSPPSLSQLPLLLLQKQKEGSWTVMTWGMWLVMEGLALYIQAPQEQQETQYVHHAYRATRLQL